jgi:hypothetical protein
MYLVVARMKVEFGKVLIRIEFIQKVIYDENGKFVKGTKIRTHVTSSFLLEDHDKKRRIGASTRMDCWNVVQY